MIAGNIETSVTETPDDSYINRHNEWLQVVNGQLPPKKPAIKILEPRYAVKLSTKQIRGARHGK